MLALKTLLLLLASVQASQFQPYDTSSLHTSSFFQQFLHDSVEESGWIVSEALKKDGSPYEGTWTIEELYKYPGMEGARGLVTKNDLSYYALSRTLPQPISIQDKDLVVQYEVKFQQDISCAGAYIKLLGGEHDAKKFNDDSDFQVRFGPDICGAQNKVDLALKKTVDSKTVVSVLSESPLARKNPLSNLYTLIIRPNRDVEIRINGQVAKAGNLYESKDFMKPSLEVSEYIPDVTAEKPDDWDDREYVLDESVSKPADWDETFGSMWIPNPEIAKPEGWNDDENIPKYVRDPSATKPAEWDDEEDGEWFEPFIKNPMCLNGCGLWEAPKIINPDYVGEWVAPSIENPNYKGEWTPPLIKNPAVTTSEVLSQDITAIGFDIWSMQADIMFKNIYVGNSVAEAEKIGNETFIPQLELEQKVYDATKPKARHQPLAPPKTFEDILNSENNVIGEFVTAFKAFYANQHNITRLFWEHFQEEPLDAIIESPFRFLGSCFFLVFAFVFSIVTLNVLMFIFLSKRLEAEAEANAARAKAKQEEEKLDKEALEKFSGISSGREASSVKTRKVR